MTDRHTPRDSCRLNRAAPPHCFQHVYLLNWLPLLLLPGRFPFER
ncbi:Uncharacterised protein [Vibrio cholerae]|nr:Uncharacterised protein [Vibrio cholerae]